MLAAVFCGLMLKPAGRLRIEEILGYQSERICRYAYDVRARFVFNSKCSGDLWIALIENKALRSGGAIAKKSHEIAAMASRGQKTESLSSRPPAAHESGQQQQCPAVEKQREEERL